MTTTLTHRRTDKDLDTGYVLLFAEDGNEHYGEHVWTLRTELPHVADCPALVDFARDYREFDGHDDTDEELVAMLNPEDIVDGADLWEDGRFVSELWEALEPAGYRTDDGAVVLDWRGVELDYHRDDE